MMGKMKMVGFSSTVILLAGCTVTPKPLTSTEIATNADRNFQRVDEGQVPVTAPIDLYEAMARALKYNLDYKVEMMQEALSARELNVSRADMLPQLAATAGYTGRNNYSGASSLSLLSGRQSLEPSTSSEKQVFAADLGLTWDVLDFGLSYVRAKQKADEVLIAREARRKVANRIIEDVRTAYWRAVSAQRLLDKLGQLEGSVTETLTNSQQLAERRVSAPLTALTYQRELVEIQTNIRQLQRELVIAKAQLAALMNLKPGTEFALVLPDRSVALPRVQFSGEDMMLTALRNRSELREVSYRQRIADREKDAALLRMLPNLKAMAGINYDSNDFLYNNDWANLGLSASWNVFNIFKYPAQKKAIKAQQELLEQRELALTMAVITQVNVARAQYGHLTQELASADQGQRVQDKIMYQVRSGNQAGAISQQTLLREEMNTLVSEVRYDIAYAAAQNAYANLFGSMGIDDLGPEITVNGDLPTLTQSLRQLWESRETALTLK